MKPYSTDFQTRLLKAMEECSVQIDRAPSGVDQHHGIVDGATVDGATGDDLEVAGLAGDFQKRACRLGQLLRAVPVAPVGRCVIDRVLSTESASGIGISSGVRIRDRVRLRGRSRSGDEADYRVSLQTGTGASAHRRARPLALTVTLVSLLLVGFFGTDRSHTATTTTSALADRGVLAAQSAAADSTVPVTLAGDDLQVLVLRVGTADREEVIRQVRAVAVANGLAVQSLDDRVDRAGDPLGVILTSVDVGRQAVSFVDGMAETDIVRSWEWNPVQIDAKARRELVTAIRQSMLSPTASELHFGEVYLAVQGGGQPAGPQGESGQPAGASSAVSVEVADSRRPSIPVESENSGVSTKSSSVTEIAERKSAGQAGRPVLVLFEFGRTPGRRIPNL